MRKIIVFLGLILGIFGTLFVVPTKVQAGGGGACGCGWTQKECVWNVDLGGWQCSWYCPCNNSGGTCVVGTYRCNDGAESNCCPIGGGAENGWTCFAAGTKVTVPKSDSMVSVVSDASNYETRNIEDIKVGDKVLSQDEAGNKSISTVTKLDQPIRDHMCRVDFAGGDELSSLV